MTGEIVNTQTEDIVVQVKADYALFSRSDSGRDKLTYHFPTPGSLRGFFKSFYHCNRLIVVPKMVEVLNPIQFTSVMRNYLNNAEYNPVRDARLKWWNYPKGVPVPGIDGLGGPASTIYLYEVAYRLQFTVTGPRKDLHRLRKRLAVGAFDNPPYLGTRECLAKLVPVDDTPPINVTLFEPAMCLSNNGPDVMVSCQAGVIVFPPETALALEHRRRENRRTFMSLFDSEEEDPDVS